MNIAAALRRRIRGPYASLGGLDGRLHHVTGELAGLRAQVELIPADLAGLRDQVERLRDQVERLHGAVRASHSTLGVLAADEPGNRHRLHALRDQPGYELAWSDPNPLVSVVIATRDRTELLTTRALPSILAQTHAELEVLVVGDGEGPETAAALRALDDPRVSYRNLPLKVISSDDDREAHLVASTLARNEAGPRVRGRWLIHFDDDDAMRPDCVATLLALARETRAEAVYGRSRVHLADGGHDDIGEWPPRYSRFTWAAGMHHAGLRYLEREFVAAKLGMPGDWWLAERMLRSGVRFAQRDVVLADIHPSWARTEGAGATE